MHKINSLGIIAFKKSNKIKNVLMRIENWCKDKNIPCICHPCLQENYAPTSPIAKDEKELLENCDALISVGGDGTFLSVAHVAKFVKKPIIGINLGGLGFLADVDPINIEEILSIINKGEHNIATRKVLKAEHYRENKLIKTYHALNDVFINRHDMPKLTTISAWYNNEFITDFTGDGIIISTPAGSTAYSLAAGGPIVKPDMEAFLLTPITPHSLTERPIILPAKGTIKLEVNEKNPDLLFSADGLDTVLLKNGDKILVSYSDLEVQIIQFEGESYFKTLRAKLNWGKNLRKKGDD